MIRFHTALRVYGIKSLERLSSEMNYTDMEDHMSNCYYHVINVYLQIYIDLWPCGKPPIVTRINTIIIIDIPIYIS